MKIKHIICIACAILAGACSEDISEDVENGKYLPGNTTNDHLLVSPATFYFSNNPTNGAARCNVTASSAWTVSGYPSWISITPVHGLGDSDFAILTEENTDFTSREATFTVRLNNTKIERTITVSQDGVSPFLRFADYNSYGASMTVSAAADIIAVALETNVSDVQVSFDYAWATPTYDNYTKTISLSVESSSSDHERNGILTVSSVTADVTLRMTVTQLAGVLTLSADAMDFSNSSDSETCQVVSGFDWQATTSCSWINIGTPSGTPGTHAVTIRVDSNLGGARQGSVIFSAGGINKTLTVRQDAATITTSRSEIDIPYYGDTANSVYVLSLGPWHASASASWISLRTTNGSGTQYLTFDVSPNNTTSARTGYIRIYNDADSSISTTVTLKQAAR